MGTRLYVGNLPFSADEAQLRALCEKGGRTVTEVKIVMDRETGRPRGFAFVEMATPEAAKAAIERWHGKDFDGRTLTVSEARPREERSDAGGYRGNDGGNGGY